ncbi:hypothetical protein [Pedobacter sp. SYSU D00535]|uniref:hypothetical protein n=1 Tax=Pedobacter sp. SYSU D00535 TaxID=2810308 RepID=UPI001A96C6FB|nr:hypothetical protein [Pedobacter sp. SYSU D00535]
MRKVKYQGAITKIVASRIGAENKDKFSRLVEDNLESLLRGMTKIQVPIQVVSFSSQKDFNEQILSIFSFLKYVGEPNLWIIYSDGTHTERQKALLNTFPFLQLRCTDFGSLSCVHKDSLKDYKEQLIDYAKKQPLGKKLLCYLNHSIEMPTLFLDSDILFYSQATILHTIIKESCNGWYLPDDTWGCLDSRYKEKTQRQLYQANSGFFLINREIENLKEGLDFLKSLNFTYEYFSEQTTFHILFRSNNFLPLDPRIFILNSGDQFDFSYLKTREEMAMRHYTGPVRHKMWQKNWKWQLSLI